MKNLLLVSIFFTFAIVVPMPTMAGADINAGISLSDTGGVYVVAEVDGYTPQGGPTGRDEKREDQSLEKGKTTEPKEKSNWKINVWPVERPEDAKTPHERKDENKHIPPDR